MFSGWLCVGGLEIGNNARARGYAESADCPVSWFNAEPCDTLADALGDEGMYTVDHIDKAPWYDPDDETTSRFYGVYLTSLGDVSSSTRVGSFTEGILDGGTPGRSRHAGKQFRVRAWLTADGEDALEAGHSWLDAALEATSCGTHAGGTCGATDATFLTACPPPREVVNGQTQTDEQYENSVSTLVRHMHDVICISGPIEIETHQSSDKIHWGRLVEFTLYAGKPWLYGDTRPLGLSPTPATIVQDVPFNLVPAPSAEVAGGAVVVATNYSTNPSVETNTTGWTMRVFSDPASSPDVAPYASTGRVVGELAASGTASLRMRILGDATEAANYADLQAEQTVDISARPAGARVSISVWAAMVNVGSQATAYLDALYARVYWLDGAGTEISGDIVGQDIARDGNFSGNVFATESMLPPAGTVSARVLIDGYCWWTSGANKSDIRLYVDALAVTVP